MKHPVDSRVPDFGPEDRALLETTGAELFRQAVTFGSLDTADPRFTDGTPETRAIELLLSVGLLRHDNRSELLLPVDPTAAQAQIVTPLSLVGSELLAESSKWAGVFAGLGQTFRSGSLSQTSAVTEIHDFDKISAWIDAALADCSKEVMTAQPHGKRPANALADAHQRDIDALERGVRMRTLYQHSARQSPGTREYVKEISARGGEVRTLDEFFNRLIVFDRKVALIPGSSDNAVAVAIHAPPIVDYLSDVFDRAWERAMPFDASGEDVNRSIAEDVRAMTLRMLAEGHSDAASAKRMGVSTRTFATYIATLKDEFGVQTRYQLGYALGRALGPATEQKSAGSSSLLEEPAD